MNYWLSCSYDIFSLHFVKMNLFYLYIGFRANRPRTRLYFWGITLSFHWKAQGTYEVPLNLWNSSSNLCPSCDSSWNCCSTFSDFQLLFSTRLFWVSLEYAHCRDQARIWRKFMSMFCVLPIAPSFWDFYLLTPSKTLQQYTTMYFVWVLTTSYWIDS